MRWVMISVSSTVPKTVPPRTASPALTLGSKAHSFSRSKLVMPMPSGIKLPYFSLMRFRGRSMPSNILPKRPGPRRTERGPPVETMDSSRMSPSVSS